MAGLLGLRTRLNIADTAAGITDSTVVGRSLLTASTIIVANAVLVPAWITTFTPTVTPTTVGTGFSATGIIFGYSRVGKTLTWSSEFAITSAGTGNSGGLDVTLPFPVLRNKGDSGWNNASGLILQVRQLGGGSLARVFRGDFVGPFAVATGDYIIIGGTYETT